MEELQILIDEKVAAIMKAHSSKLRIGIYESLCFKKGMQLGGRTMPVLDVGGCKSG